MENPLCGPDGAAAVFGPQKGATPGMVRALDRGLARLARVLRADLGAEIAGRKGGGAAGGLAAGAAAFWGARLVPGIDEIMKAVGLPEALAPADWCVTGEGRFDPTSLRGKVVSGVLREARRSGAQAALIAGRVALPETEWRAAGLSLAASLSALPGGLAAARSEPAAALEEAARRMAPGMTPRA